MSTQSTSAISRAAQHTSSFDFVDATSSQSSKSAVVQIVKDHINPHLGGSLDVFTLLGQNSDLRCRLLTVSKAHLGVVVYDNHRRTRYAQEGLPECFSIEHFHASEAIGGRYMLNAALESARELNAKSVSVKVAKAADRVIALLEENQFRRIRESGSRLWLYGKSIEPEQTQHSGHKRRRVEDSSSSSSSSAPVSARKVWAGAVAGSAPRLTSSTIGMQYLRMIQSGRKTVEGRIASGMFAKLSVDQNIQFFCGTEKALCRVVRITKYPTFREMLSTEGVSSCLPDKTDLESAAQVYAKIPTYPERERQHGVVAIELQLQK